MPSFSSSFDANTLATSIIGSGITFLGGAAISGTSTQFSIASIPELGMPSGILITTGDGTPPISNTSSAYGEYASNLADPQLTAVLTATGLYTGYTDTYDAASLTFNFSASGGNAVKFNVIFGSDEYPEWASSYPDIAGVFVDGVNYAFFAGPTTPLSVLQGNVDAGYFINNEGGILPIEYDGVSNMLQIVAPLNTGLSTHTIKIAIADTGDQIYDSAMFITNFTVETANTGGVQQLLGGGTTGNDTLTGGLTADFVQLGAGDDYITAGGGDDLIKGNAGADTIFGGEGFDELFGGGDGDLLIGNLNGDTIQAALGDDTVQGGNGRDRLQGGGGNDSIVGGLGADSLIGGAGDDTMTGGGGPDVFIFGENTGNDNILDFTPFDGVTPGDKISVFVGANDSALFTAQDLYDALADDGLGNSVLDLGGVASVKIVGVLKADIAVDDFMVF